MAPQIRPLYPAPNHGPSADARNLKLLAGMALAIGLGQLAGNALSMSSPDASSSTQPVWAAGLGSPTTLAQSQLGFVPQASGIVDQELPLLTEPAGGAERARVAAGTPLAIGGRVRVPLGLWSQSVYWVRLDTAGGALYGFVSADALHLTAGAPLDLDVSGIPSDAFLAPSPGSQYAGGERLSSSAAGTDRFASELQASSSSAGRVSGGIEVDWLPASLAPWLPELVSAGERHGVDPELLAVLTLVESGGNPDAQSGSGAIGLMQVMPATGTDIARQRGITGFSVDALWDPETNIDFGAWYIARQLAAFGIAGDPDWQQSVELAAAAYNGGPGTVQALLQSGRSLPGETRRYREWVGGMWRERGETSSATFEAWWSAGGSRLVQAAEARLAAR